MAAATTMMKMLFFPAEVEEPIQADSFRSPVVSAVEDLAVAQAAADSVALVAAEVLAAVVLLEVGKLKKAR